MKKTEKISLTRFRNNEHFQFMIHVNKLILTFQASVLGIDDLYPDFRSMLNAEDTAMCAEFAGRESSDVRVLRIQIDRIYEQMSDRINVSMIMDTAKPVAISFVSELNQKIKYYKTTMASHNTRNQQVEVEAVNN